MLSQINPEEVDVADALRSLDTDGFAVVPDVLSPDEVDAVVGRLWAASDESQRRGIPAHLPTSIPTTPTSGSSTCSTSTRCSPN